jgi:glycyl-tRNA synthetase
MFLTILSHSYTEEEVNGESRTVLSIPAILAPVKATVLPLTKKDGLPEKAKEILNSLKREYNCQYEEKDSIGKRYRRQDAIGTPFCITVDHQSLEDNTVTLRDRDTMEQKRIAISELRNLISEKVDFKYFL